MMEFNIVNLVGSGMTAEVVDAGSTYLDYADFADEAGFPNASLPGRRGTAKRLGGKTVSLLAKGNHGTFDRTLYIIQTDVGEQFIIGERGLADIVDNRLTTVTLDELLAEIKRRHAGEPAPQPTIEPKQAPRPPKVKTRDEIVEMAKSDIADLADKMVRTRRNHEGNFAFRQQKTTVDYVVNKEKRTVVALVKRLVSRDLLEKGIAKCDPSDCFNAHIGRAIALRRALGLDVPDEYLMIPQPEEVREGDEIRSKYAGGSGRTYTMQVESIGKEEVKYVGGSFDYVDVLPSAEIIDDSRE